MATKNFEMLHDTIMEQLIDLLSNNKLYLSLWSTLTVKQDVFAPTYALLFHDENLGESLLPVEKIKNTTSAITLVTKRLKGTAEKTEEEITGKIDGFTLLQHINHQCQMRWALNDHEWETMVDCVIDASHRSVVVEYLQDDKKEKDVNYRRREVKDLILTNSWLFLLILMEAISGIEG